jgi:endonuclease/exonuclease/phosphatase family metal-dependent hydrolase
MNHRELWQYRDAIPLDLAKLQPDQVRNDRVRGTKHPGALSKSIAHCNRSETLKLLCVTWNVGATLPIADQNLTPLLSEEPAADIICLGFQEVCSLTMKRLMKDGEEWTEWKTWAEKGVETTYNGELELLQERHLVGLLMLVFVRKRLKSQVTDVRACVIPTGVGGVGGNKGAVCARFEIGTTSLCFVNAHLAAGQEHYIERCQHFRTIIERILFRHADDAAGDVVEDGDQQASFLNSRKSFRDCTARSVTVCSADGGEETPRTEVYTVHDHDHIIWLGDTNSRLHWPGQLGGMPIEQAVQKVRERRIGELLALDQLTLMIRDGMAFDGFEELKIHFLPSYKWRPGGDALDMRSQKHVPAWTDRILFRSQTRPPAEALRYDMHLGLKQSDHRPVFACLNIPWEGMADKDGSPSGACLSPHRDSVSTDSALRGSIKNDGESAALSLYPSDASFTEAKPDRTKDCNVKLTLVSGGAANFKVFLRRSDGELENVQSTPPDPAVCREKPEDDVDITKWLSVSPTEGRIVKGETKEVRISLNLCRAVLKRQSAEACLVFSVSGGSSPSKSDCRLPVQAMIEPSVMRIPLPALHALGSRPIIQDAGPLEVTPDSSSLHLPPKEVMCVMQWVLMQSRDEAPGSLQWWPDPLLDGARRGQDKKCAQSLCWVIVSSQDVGAMLL